MLLFLMLMSAPAVAVVDGSDRLVGLVTSETIGEMLMLHRAIPPGARLRLGPWSVGAIRPERDGKPVKVGPYLALKLAVRD